MMARDLNPAVGATDSSAEASAAVELQQALWSWQTLCDQAIEGISGHDLDAADEALASREALRPRVEALVTRLRSEAGPTREALHTIQRLQRSASEADARLVSALEGEQFRLRRDIDGLGRPSAPAAAYGRVSEPSRHRLDIVR